MVEQENYSCEGLYQEIMELAGTFQKSLGLNHTDLCNCIIDKSQKSENCSFDLLDYFSQENKLLKETFNISHNELEKFEGRIWIEWIWGFLWILIIEVIGNGCLFCTIAYER